MVRASEPQPRKRVISVPPPPILVRAGFAFSIGGHTYRFTRETISLFGITGLRWKHFNPIDRVGEPVEVEVQALTEHPFRFKTPARLTAEVTTDATFLGMKFYLDAHTESRLVRAVRAEGYCPTTYIRKYPRIPAWTSIPNMPMRAVAAVSSGDLVVFDIGNMSANGILIHTENANAAVFAPGSPIRAQVEPRGEIFDAFAFAGGVRRIVLARNPESGNIVRYLGVQFVSIGRDDRKNLLAILRAVLENIQRPNKE